MKLNFSELSKRISKVVVPRTRFAPSPSGYLHLGHVAHAMFVCGISNRLGAEISLRIEDHDCNRSKEIFAQQILLDLEWLGFAFDRDKVYFQSQQTIAYQNAISKLSRQGLLYRCLCSRAEIKTRQEARGELDNASFLRYDGFCRDRKISSSQPSTLRIKVNQDQLLEFWDAYRGEISNENLQSLTDFALVDRNGFFTYQFAVVVDDLAQGVNLIIRGSDILPSSSNQLFLRLCLSPNEPEPIFVHHPLMYQSAQKDKKLSKKDKDESIRGLRAAGYKPADLFNIVADKMGINLNANVTDLMDLDLS